MSPRESTARPCGAAKLPGAHASGVPQRASTRPSVSNTLTRPYRGSVMGPCRCEVCPRCHQSSDTYARPLGVGPFREVLTVRAEDLDAVVLSIAHEDPAVGRGGDAVRQVELARTLA